MIRHRRLPRLIIVGRVINHMPYRIAGSVTIANKSNSWVKIRMRNRATFCRSASTDCHARAIMSS